MFARSYVFKVISRMFVLLVIFGLFFGMLLLPVLLSLCGPATSSAGDDMHGARGDEATGAVATAATGPVAEKVGDLVKVKAARVACASV